MKRSPRSGKSDSGPCHIGKILGSVLASDNGCISENRAAEDKPAKPKFALERADEDRIIKLERQLEHLGRQIQNLTRIINAELPSK